MNKKGKKEYSVRDDHRARALVMGGVFLSSVLDLMIEIGVIDKNGDSMVILDAGLSFIMLAALLFWVIPMIRYKAQTEDEMALANLNNAQSIAIKVLITVYGLLVIACSVCHLNLPITLNADVLNSSLISIFSLYFGLQSLFFLMIESKYNKDESED